MIGRRHDIWHAIGVGEAGWVQLHSIVLKEKKTVVTMVEPADILDLFPADLRARLSEAVRLPVSTSAPELSNSSL